MTGEVMRLAQNLARNCGYAPFPCRSTPENKDTDKTPTWPKREGGQGYKDATTDPDRIAWMWQHWPGELIGVATGEVSNLWILDIDRKHAEACAWWQINHHRLLPTRAYGTRSGGIHLHYRDGEGIGCTVSRICKGIDTRGSGGYVIHWFAAGFTCHDHSPPAPWPAWLRAALTPPPRPAESYRGTIPTEAAIAGIIRRVAEAQEGERNAVVFWGACRLIERGMRQREIEALLIPVAIGIGLSDIEARRTINSAQGRAVA
jgi:Bifunctional DNA primase/polymerase, N-terminal